MNLNTIIRNKDAVSLLALSQVNFHAGINMMKTLREQSKKVKTEDSIRPVADDFEDVTPVSKDLVPLDVSANLVAASLLLASSINDEHLDFLKKNIRSPKGIIVSQMDWIANQEAQQRLMAAQKLDVKVSVDFFIEKIKGQQQEKINTYLVEAQSAIHSDIRSVDDTDLIHLIENTYVNKEWLTKLEDSSISLYEGAVKRIEEGKFADLPDELIDFAKAALKKRGK